MMTINRESSPFEYSLAQPEYLLSGIARPFTEHFRDETYNPCHVVRQNYNSRDDARYKN